MKQRVVLLALGVLVALVPASIAMADPGGQQDHPRGLEQACSHQNVNEKNPNCPGNGGDDGDPNNAPGGGSGSGGSGSNPTPPTPPAPHEQRGSCLSGDEDTGLGTCGGDDDGDGRANAVDNCRSVSNPGQMDDDGDGWGNKCDEGYRHDADNDGVVDDGDNCPSDANPGQRDVDGDGAGDVCDGDDANDRGRGNDVPDDLDPYYSEAHGAVTGVIDALPEP